MLTVFAPPTISFRVVAAWTILVTMHKRVTCYHLLSIADVLLQESKLQRLALKRISLHYCRSVALTYSNGYYIYLVYGATRLTTSTQQTLLQVFTISPAIVVIIFVTVDTKTLHSCDKHEATILQLIVCNFVRRLPVNGICAL